MGIRIRKLTDRTAVEAAIQEYDTLGRSAFLAKHGYREAHTYFIDHNGNRYDSKAIAAVAYGIQYPNDGTPKPSDFSGGEQTVAQTLRAMGYRLTEVSTPAKLISRASVESVLDEWDRIGRDAFLSRHGVTPAQRFVIQRGTTHYDAKAVVAVAYRQEHRHEDPIQSGDFSGNAISIRKPLEALGFTITDVRNATPTSWMLEPNQNIVRKELHQKYGGGGQGGIAHSAKTPNVMLFSDPSSGEQHGYFDRWVSEHEFHYAGEGQHGDQQLIRGNAAIVDHQQDGRALRLFWGSSGTVTYAGEFTIADDNPYYWVDAPESGGGPDRRVIMFRLIPNGSAIIEEPRKPQRRTVRPLLQTSYKDVDPSKGAAPRDPFEVDPDKIDRGLKGHAQTQQTLAQLAKEHGNEILSPGPGDPNFDLAWKHHGEITVVEAKSLTHANEAGQIRLGLGQVLDYQHRLEQHGYSVTAVLAVEREPADPTWAALCRRHDVKLVWPASFETLFSTTTAGECLSVPRALL